MEAKNVETEVADTLSTAPQATAAPSRKPRGFAAMDRETLRALARKGGRAVQQSGKGHKFTSEEARAASRKAVDARRARAASKDPGDGDP
jgi:general stress protein YciG